MAEVGAVDFNTIPRQRLSKSDIRKVASIVSNLQEGNKQQAQEEFDSFARDKKMDKLRSAVLGITSAVAIMSIAIAKHRLNPGKFFPDAAKEVGDVIAKGIRNFANNHEKVYNKIAKKFPEVVGNVGDNFASKAFDSTSLFKRAIKKVLCQNEKVTEKAVTWLSSKGIKNFGDCVGIGVAAIVSAVTSWGSGKIGNILDEYGDGDRQFTSSKSDKQVA